MPQLLGMARCVASLCSMHVRRLRLPLPRLGRLPLLGRCKRAWQTVPTPVELCVRGTASGSVQASHVGSFMHCVLGTRGAAASACIAAASVATLSSFLGRLRCLPFILSADATRCPCGSAAALHSRHTTRARPRLASLGFVLPLGLRAWCSVALAARLACKLCGDS